MTATNPPPAAETLREAAIVELRAYAGELPVGSYRSKRLDEIADLLDALAAPDDITCAGAEGVREIAKAVYLAGHSEGWTGNQQRRDVQHVDAQKGWDLYVVNGALDKLFALLPARPGPVVDGAAEVRALLREAVDYLDRYNLMPKSRRKVMRDALLPTEAR